MKDRLLVLFVDTVGWCVWMASRIVSRIRIWFIASVIAFIDGREEGDE